MRVALTLIVPYLISSCARADHAEAWPDRFIVTAGPQPGYAIKQVVEKQSPVTLVGDDGSVCRTSVQRFAEVKVGKWIACDWTLPGLNSTELARR